MKKGNVGVYATIIISFVLAAVILTGIAFPQWRTTTTPQTASDVVAHVQGAGNSEVSLTETDLVSGGLSISGLAVTTNYTVDYENATVTVLNATTNGTYYAVYSFYEDGYIESSSSRSLAGVVILLIIVGLAAGLFRMFGLI